MAKKVSVSKELDARFENCLKSGEHVESIFFFGLMRILTTKERVILIKGFPKNIISFRFKDIESAGFMTSIKWLYLILALFLVSFSHLINLVKDSFLIRLFSLKEVLFLVGLVFALGGLYCIVRFIISLFGRLVIILKYDHEPIRFVTSYNKNTIQLINTIESKSK